jgi:hypothetical protein
MSYEAKLVMHINYGSKGGSRTSELTKFPGVFVKDDWDAKARKNTRTIFFEEREFKTLDSAVKAWESKQNAKAKGE